MRENMSEINCEFKSHENDRIFHLRRSIDKLPGKTCTLFEYLLEAILLTQSPSRFLYCLFLATAQAR